MLYIIIFTYFFINYIDIIDQNVTNYINEMLRNIKK